MKVKYIAIEREYGSGGTEIGTMLSEETGIPCYGKEVLTAAAQKLNKSEEQIQELEENMVGSFLYTVYLMGRVHDGDSTMLTGDGAVFVAEQEAIQRFAANGRGIFVGHCAGEALREYPGVVRVFIRCSDEKQRKQRITQEYGIPAERAESVRKKFDHKRAHYYRCNTGHNWNDLSRYDVVLDSAVLGTEGCVRLLKNLFEETSLTK